MKSSSKFKFGPGLIVTAAFIGPGTVTTCTLAGAGYGYSLLWAIVFAIFATFILHEMSGRVGLVGKLGLGEALYRELPGRTMKIFGMIMVVIAIGVGNAALQTGNILGASLGLAALTDIPENVWPFIVGACAFCLLWFGSYKLLEKIFIGFVVLMSFCFIVTAAVIRPDISSIVTGIFVPQLNDSNFYIALGLVGTTIVPYNFFIYAMIIQKKWQSVEDLGAARLDMVFSLIIGGLISMAIIITSSAAFYGRGIAITNGADMALQLEPLLGTWAKAAIAMGLFGAGMSSATAAPLGAAIALTGVFQWDQNESGNRFRLVWCSVLVTGVFFALIGLQPVSAILFAQAANAVFIPIVALFLLYVVNKKGFLGEHVNTIKGNVVAGLILVFTIILASRGVLKMLEYFKIFD